MADQEKIIRLLIADDHLVMLDGLVSLLREEKNIEITDTANNGEQVIDLVGRNEYDICLLDINMPKLDGIEAAKWIRKNKPHVKIIILTTHNEEEIIAEMLYIGVSGYMLKTSTRRELTEGINRVMSGKMFFTDEVQAAILNDYINKSDPQKRSTAGVIVFTERESEILQLLAGGFTNDKIAENLRISFRTVETHRKNMMQKTKSHNLAGLLEHAYKKGLIKG
jgi:DNA-binding NarL/FixJ family response regulator